MNDVVWEEEFDDDDNSIWTAPSPFHDEGVSFLWRLKQRLRENRIEWYAAHDEEPGGDCEGVSWLSLDEAKAATAVDHAGILDEL